MEIQWDCTDSWSIAGLKWIYTCVDYRCSCLCQTCGWCGRGSRSSRKQRLATRLLHILWVDPFVTEGAARVLWWCPAGGCDWFPSEMIASLSFSSLPPPPLGRGGGRLGTEPIYPFGPVSSCRDAAAPAGRSKENDWYHHCHKKVSRSASCTQTHLGPLTVVFTPIMFGP